MPSARSLLDPVHGGGVLVAAVAARVVAVGLYMLVRGFTDGFMRDIDLPAAPDRDPSS